MSDVTQILQKIERGDSHAAAEELLPLVYQELRKLAAAKMNREYAPQTLQPTALVHEAWLRLGGDGQPSWQNRAHFFAAAAEAMRRILIDRARQRRTRRHGGDQQRLNADHIELSNDEEVRADEQLLALHEALEMFTLQEPQKSMLVKLRYFAGMTLDEAAVTMGIPEGTAKRWWTYSRAHLFRTLRPSRPAAVGHARRGENDS